MEIRISKTYEELSRRAAGSIAAVINAKPNAVLGLATGSSPLGIYRELVRLHKDEGLDFSQVTTFNLDEYVGLSAQHGRSYHHFMRENLFKHINVPPERTHIPSGTTNNYRAFCQWYEDHIRACGGIDVQLLGIGSDGHIAFNEPTSSLASRRPKTLPGRRSKIRPILRQARGCARLRDHHGRARSSSGSWCLSPAGGARLTGGCTIEGGDCMSRPAHVTASQRGLPSTSGRSEPHDARIL